MRTVLSSIIASNQRCDDVFSYLYGLEKDILSTRELEQLHFIQDIYTQAEKYPSPEYLATKFPELQTLPDPLPFDDILPHAGRLVIERKNQLLSSKLMSVASKLITGDKESLSELSSVLVTTETQESVPFDISLAKDLYSEVKSKSTGLSSGLQDVDKLIGGLSYGSVTSIMGFTGQFKSLWCTNIAYYNSYYLGYNVCMISLEVPKKDVLWNILSRHSYSPEIEAVSYIGHEDIRRGILSEETEQVLFNQIVPDLQNNSKGKLIILDETDFKDFSFAEIIAKLYEVDTQVGGLDAVIVDHVGLCKFSKHTFQNVGEDINQYVSFFRKLSIKFRFDQVQQKYRQLAVVLAVQANREGWKRAAKKGGQYDLRGVSEANEVERASYRIFSIYTDDYMKEAKEARVCVLKNRSGRTTTEPLITYVDPVCYYLGDEVSTITPGSELSGEEFNILLSSNSDLFMM